jgi:hypothetical protein
MKPLHVLFTVLLASAAGLAFPDYTGYSGAPGSAGTCAGSCHGTGGGTLSVSGFPTAYVAGQSYLITVGGSGMSNFNASVRVGSGSQIAGTLTAGTNTETYSVSGETQGVHLSSPDQDNGTFTWTAPDPPVGAVGLYFAGHRNGYDGPNTVAVLTAQGNGVTEPRPGRTRAPYLRVEPTVVHDRLVIRVGGLPAEGRMLVCGVDGRVVIRRNAAASVEQALLMATQDDAGRRLPAGSYQVLLASGGERLLQRFSVR